MTKKEIQKEYRISMLMNPSEENRQLSLKEEQSYKKCLDSIKDTFERWDDLDDNTND